MPKERERESYGIQGQKEHSNLSSLLFGYFDTIAEIQDVQTVFYIQYVNEQWRIEVKVSF